MQTDGSQSIPDSPMQPDLLRAARAMLDWSLVEASRMARVSVATITSIERVSRAVSSEDRNRLKHAYQAAGITFRENGPYSRGLDLTIAVIL